MVRFRYHIITVKADGEQALLAEDCQLLGFSGSASNQEWLSPERAEDLLSLRPDENLSPDQAKHFLNRISDNFDGIWPQLEKVAIERGDALLDAHRRVRRASVTKGIKQRIEPHLPPDVLGIYVYLPARSL